MAGHDIITIGASTGGIDALTRLARSLPADLPAALLIVQHMSPEAPNHLPDILSHAGALPALEPEDGQDVQPGHIYVAPPDRHLLIERGCVRLIRGPRENHVRPAIDPLFRSAAIAYGPRVVGVILTGALDDGTAGLLAIKRRGGIAVVQDPKDALVPSMPKSVLEYVRVDYCLPLAGMAHLLVRLTYEAAEMEAVYPVPRDMELESQLAAQDLETRADQEQPGVLSPLTCPECKGPLWELHDGDLMRFRCRQGHAYTAENMLAGQMDGVEAALWTAINILDENTRMLQRMASDARHRKLRHLAARLEEQLQERVQQARLLRQVVLGGKSTVTTPTDTATARELEARAMPPEAAPPSGPPGSP